MTTFPGPISAVASSTSNSFYYDSGGSTVGNRYADFSELYSAVQKARAVSAGPFTIVTAEGETIPAGSFDYTDVKFLAEGALTFADGSIATVLPWEIRRRRAKDGGGNLVFDTLTTSFYTGASTRMMIRGFDECKTSNASTVPAFSFSDGGLARFYWYYTRPTESLGAPLVYLSNTSWFLNYMFAWATINDNPFGDDGGGDERIYVYWLDPNTVGLWGVGHPDDRTLGTTSQYVSYQFSMVEGLASITGQRPQWMPYFRMQDGMISGTISEPLMSKFQFGEIVAGPAPGGVISLATEGYARMDGISYDTITARNLVDEGWFTSWSVAGGIGGTAGWAQDSGIMNRQGRLFVFMRFRLNRNGSEAPRFFAGLTGTHLGASRGGSVATNTPTGDLIGVQFVNSRDTNLQVIHQKSGGDGQHLIDTGVDFTNGNTYCILIDGRYDAYNSVKIYGFYDIGFWPDFEIEIVDDGNNLPAVTSMLGINQMCRNLSATNSFHQFNRCQFCIGDAG